MTKNFLSLPSHTGARTLLAALVIMTLASCKKDTESSNKVFHFDYNGSCHCGADNPLEELEWLHNNAVMFESMRDKQWASISICTYDSLKQGFLINACVNCYDAGVSLYDCEGNYIGMVSGFAGIPLSTYNIDPASIREIYRNYPDTAASLVGKRWRLQYFLDRETWQPQAPLHGNDTIPFWLQFNNDGTIIGGGINQLNGTFVLYDNDRIGINIHSTTEIYDQTGWEERLLDALNDATICDIDYYGRSIRIYYDLNRKFLAFTQM